MPVKLGAKPEHGFDEPLGLLSDCHRRIESFLEVMIQVVQRTRGGQLNAEQRQALEAALKYFSTAAPRHTEDEEASLFPRMRCSTDPHVRVALARIDALEAEHRRAEALHGEVERSCRQWLEQGQVSSEQAEHLMRLLGDLRAAYATHIAIEDSEIFPLAQQALSATELQQVGQEMAQRRGIAARE